MLSVQCEELRINHPTLLLIVTMPYYTCWFLRGANCIEDFKWCLHFQFGVAFWRVVLRYVYFEGPNCVWRLQSWTSRPGPLMSGYTHINLLEDYHMSIWINRALQPEGIKRCLKWNKDPRVHWVRESSIFSVHCYCWGSSFSSATLLLSLSKCTCPTMGHC